MNFLKKIRIPLIILILLTLVIISIVIIRNVLVVARNTDAALDFASEMPSDLDDIFSDDFLDDQINIGASTATNNNTVTTDVVGDKQVSIDVIEQTDIIPSEVIPTDSKPAIPIKPNISTNKVNIDAFLIEKYTASRRSPTYITLVVKAPLETSYLNIKVFARKLSKNNEIISRELVFTLPKVYTVNGQGQTQFYFSGRYAGSSKYVSKGRYIIYSEVIGYDKNGNQLSSTGQYAMPKFDNVITIQ